MYKGTQIQYKETNPQHNKQQNSLTKILKEIKIGYKKLKWPERQKLGKEREAKDYNEMQNIHKEIQNSYNDFKSISKKGKTI